MLVLYRFDLCNVRSVLLPWFDRELQSGRRGALQVHPGGVQDGTDEGGGTHLP